MPRDPSMSARLAGRTRIYLSRLPQGRSFYMAIVYRVTSVGRRQPAEGPLIPLFVVVHFGGTRNSLPVRGYRLNRPHPVLFKSRNHTAAPLRHRRRVSWVEGVAGQFTALVGKRCDGSGTRLPDIAHRQCQPGTHQVYH